MQHFEVIGGLTDHTFLRPPTPVDSGDSTIRGKHKHSDSTASQNFDYQDPFHIRNDSTSSLSRAGQVDFGGQQGFEGIPIGSRGIGDRPGEDLSHFGIAELRDARALWALNTTDIGREGIASSLTSPVSTIATNADSVSGLEALPSQSTGPHPSSEDIEQYLRQAHQHFQQAQHLEEVRQAHQAEQIDKAAKQLHQQQQTRARSVSQPSHFAQPRFSFPLDFASTRVHNIMNPSPARPSVDKSNNVSPDHVRNVGSSPSQSLEHAYFPVNGMSGAHGSQFGAGAHMNQAGNNLQVEQQIAMMNAIKSINMQLPPDGRVPASQPVSPVANNHANNGMMPFSTPAGLSTQQHHVHTRPRGMTVGTVPIMPMHLASGYQHDFATTPIHNGSIHGTPEAMFSVAKHLTHTQGPSPAASPFNMQPRESMVPHTAPPSPGSQFFAQEIENNMFMNPAQMTPQRVTSTNPSQHEAPQSLQEFNPVPTLENQALAYGLGEIRMSVPMSASNSQASFPASTRATGSIGAGEDGGVNKSTMESRRSSGAGLGQGMSMQMSMLSSSQGHTLSEGQSTSIPPLAIATDSNQVEELSHELKEKLSFLTNLQNKLTAAINEAQMNHPRAVDEYLSDIKKAIVNKENEPRTPSTAASGSGHLSAFSSGLQRQASPLSVMQTSNNRMESVTPINISLGAPNPLNSNAHEALSNALLPNNGGLLAPVELSRAASSTKRSAPESPVMDGDATAQNKHMRLEQEMEGIEPASTQSGQSQTGLPPQMVHAHSYPQAGPGQQPMMAVPMNAMATLAGAMTQHIPGTHTPVNPSPLSHVSNAPPNNPYGFGHPTGIHLPVDPSMQNWSTQHVVVEGNYPMQSMAQIQQPPTMSRRGSIVDGRLIAPRPRVGDARSITTGAIPTMNTFGMTAIPTSHSVIPFHQQSGIEADFAVDDAELDEEDESDDDEGQLKRRPSKRRRSSDQATTSEGTLIQPPDLISDEIRAELDKIMFEFLNDICSDLNATDAKGELIHQPLMKKKMDRLDASTDFRPFKFRIQAFTNAFSELLQRKGILEETLPAKKIKSYLWNQRLISRFNDDGKKSKSKGNHIWNVDAKKLTDGQWIFRPFQRKIHLPEPLHAWYGSKFAWQPKVWDPQASTSNLKVDWRFEGLPPWLEWKENVKGLEGIPMEGDSSANITVTAVFRDSSGKELSVSTRFFLPVGHLEASNAAATTTPAGLMLSAMNAPAQSSGSIKDNANSASNPTMSEIKQEPSIRLTDSPLRDIADIHDSMASSFHSQASGMSHEMSLNMSQTMANMDPSMFDAVNFGQLQMMGDGNSQMMFHHPLSNQATETLPAMTQTLPVPLTTAHVLDIQAHQQAQQQAQQQHVQSLLQQQMQSQQEEDSQP